MSIWTHVTCNFRIDSLRIFDKPLTKEIAESIFGREVLFGSGLDVWDEYEKNPQDFLPAGSEGSLEIDVYTNPDDHSIAAYVVSIFGDLRDYEDLESIYDWFYKSVTESKLMIRQAMVHATCENGNSMAAFTNGNESGVIRFDDKQCFDEFERITWCERDVMNALDEKGYEPSYENTKIIVEHLKKTKSLQERSTEYGWEVIYDAIFENREELK